MGKRRRPEWFSYLGIITNIIPIKLGLASKGTSEP